MVHNCLRGQCVCVCVSALIRTVSRAKTIVSIKMVFINRRWLINIPYSLNLNTSCFIHASLRPINMHENRELALCADCERLCCLSLAYAHGTSLCERWRIYWTHFAAIGVRYTYLSSNACNVRRNALRFCFGVFIVSWNVHLANGNMFHTRVCLSTAHAANTHSVHSVCAAQ